MAFEVNPSWALVAVSFSVLALAIYYNFLNVSRSGKNGRGKKKLPGPPSLPIIGSIPFLVTKFSVSDFKMASFQVLHKMMQIWGSPMALHFGQFYTVIVDDITLGRKIAMSDDWANRCDDSEFMYERSFGKHLGLLVANGEGWREMRRFVHKTMAKFGLGRSNALELNLEEEIGSFFENLDEKRVENGNVVPMQHLFYATVNNVLWKMIGDIRFGYNDPQFKVQVDLMEDLTSVIHPREAAIFVFPWIRFVPWASSFKQSMRVHEKLHKIFQDLIDTKRQSGTYKTNQDNFIDSFLFEMDQYEYRNQNQDEQNVTNNNSNVGQYYSDEQLMMILVDFVITGFIPSGSCLEYLILFMIQHPDIQAKCREEVDLVVGANRLPSINDSEKMPYTQATILEVLRRVTFIPFTMRAATRDTYVNDCFVPKNSLALLAIYNMHNNPKVWDCPEEFRPDRFLDSNGHLCNQELIMPFGAGRRVCPAEVLARVSIFTYFAYLLQRYTFELPPNHPPLDETPNVGLGNYPKPFHALIKSRA